MTRPHRPLAEPLVVSHEQFNKKKVPSNTRLNTRNGLVICGLNTLIIYQKPIFTGASRMNFEKDRSKMVAEKIKDAFNEGVTDMMRWEWKNIDQDGGTTKMENMLKEGRPNVFNTKFGVCIPEAVKYGQLVSLE